MQTPRRRLRKKLKPRTRRTFLRPQLEETPRRQQERALQFRRRHHWPREWRQLRKAKRAKALSNFRRARPRVRQVLQRPQQRARRFLNEETRKANWASRLSPARARH